MAAPASSTHFDYSNRNDIDGFDLRFLPDTAESVICPPKTEFGHLTVLRATNKKPDVQGTCLWNFAVLTKVVVPTLDYRGTYQGREEITLRHCKQITHLEIPLPSDKQQVMEKLPRNVKVLILTGGAVKDGEKLPPEVTTLELRDVTISDQTLREWMSAASLKHLTLRKIHSITAAGFINNSRLESLTVAECPNVVEADYAKRVSSVKKRQFEDPQNKA